jgi:hypothetical protein
LAAICCVAVAFNWYDQRLSSPNSARPLSPDDARLDIVSIQPVLDDNIKSLLLNYRYANNGKIAAIGELHQGAVIASQQPLYEELIDGMVTILRAQLFANKGEPTSEIQPGQSDRFFTIPPVNSQNLENYNSYKDGNRFVYGIVLIRYRDREVGRQEHLYTESCVYFIEHVEHYCESGHNQTYIMQDLTR